MIASLFRFMSNMNMKQSDIRIVSYCLDYMQLLDPQGDLNKEMESNVSI